MQDGIHTNQFRPTGIHTFRILLIAIAVAIGLGFVASVSVNVFGAPDRSIQRHVTASYLPAAVDGELVAAFLGDSYTSGSGASDPSRRWSSLVAQRMEWVERNFGAGSTGYWQSAAANPNYLGRLDALAAERPDIVVVAGGQNDLFEYDRDADEVARAVTNTYNKIRALLPGARIVAVGPSDPLGVPPVLVSLDQQVQIAAQAVGAEYVSLIAPEPVIQSDMVVANGHVDDSGHEAIADRVVSVLSR